MDASLTRVTLADGLVFVVQTVANTVGSEGGGIGYRFLDDSVATINRTTPTLRLTRRLLRAGTPTIEADPQRVVTGAFGAPFLLWLLARGRTTGAVEGLPDLVIVSDERPHRTQAQPDSNNMLPAQLCKLVRG